MDIDVFTQEVDRLAKLTIKLAVDCDMSVEFVLTEHARRCGEISKKLMEERT